jgi:hypothetical protein
LRSLESFRRWLSELILLFLGGIVNHIYRIRFKMTYSLFKLFFNFLLLFLWL